MREKMVLTEYDINRNKCNSTIYENLAPTITIALVTDLHEYDPTEVLQLLKQASPDMICIAGDTFERHGSGKKRESGSQYLYRFLREVSKITDAQGRTAPVFMSLGNHEWYLNQKDKKAIQDSGIILLDNTDVKTCVKDVKLCIGGLSTRVDESWLEEFSHKAGYKILLSHHPEYYKAYIQSKDIDLILSGHAHGGQIRVLGHGLFSPGQGLFPRYSRGVYDGRLVVSTGCANTATIPRWGNPCEVVLIHLEGTSRERKKQVWDMKKHYD